eukprot:TsM_001230800 transcript=TsM_001230800 gene=TsM_001230800
MRTLERGATWPVGCITDPNYRNKISYFWSNYIPDRKFPIDMAACAVNLNLVLEHPNALFDLQVVGGQEGLILTGLGFQSAHELEPKADGCRKVRPTAMKLLSFLAFKYLHFNSLMWIICLDPCLAYEISQSGGESGWPTYH